MIELPGYSIVRTLGRGGMATVYLAEQHSLGRQVALKVLSPSLAADSHFVERFLREGRLAAQLHHRHIVSVYDVGRHGDVVFVSMEYLSRGSVPPLPTAPPEVLRLLREIGSALDAAHAAGIVHRDLKPDNILVHEDGAYLLSDFGIAFVRESTSIVTREGTTLGTPEFMSPEQWRNLTLDGRSDLYSLGIVMYQLLCGRLPYAGGDGWSIGMQHMNAALPRLPKEFAALQPLLDSLLAKDPPARLASAAELVRRVEALEQSGKVPTQPLSAPAVTTPLPSLPSRRFDRRTWALASVVVLGLVALALWRGTPDSAPQTVSIAVLPFAAASPAVEDVQFAEGLADELLDALARTEGMTVAASPSVHALREATTEADEIGRRLKVGHVLEAAVHRDGERVRLSARLSDAGDGRTRWSRTLSAPVADLPALQRELVEHLSRELLGRAPRDAAGARRAAASDSAEAYASYLRGRRVLDQPTSAESLETAIALFQQALAADSRFARAQAGICIAEVRRFKRQLDPMPLERARRACAEADALEADLAEIAFARGELAQVRGEHATALAEFERAALDPALRPAAWLAAANSHLALDQPEQAGRLLEAARALQPGWWLVHSETGRFRMAQGDYEGAAQMFRLALDFRPERPLSQWNNLGTAYLLGDDFERAAEAFEASLALGDSPSALSNLGTVRFHLGQFSTAAELYRRACAAAPKDHRLWGNLGDALAADPATVGEAEAAYGEALQLAQALLAERLGNSEETADLAFYHASLGHADAARVLIAGLGETASASADLAFRSALVYARLGDTAQAGEAAQTALKLGYPQRLLRTTPLLAAALDTESDHSRGTKP